MRLASFGSVLVLCFACWETVLQRNHPRDSSHAIFRKGRTPFSEAQNAISSSRSHQKAKFAAANTMRTSGGASINLTLLRRIYWIKQSQNRRVFWKRSPETELKIAATDLENRLQSRNESWMIAANDQTSSRSRHRSA